MRIFHLTSNCDALNILSIIDIYCTLMSFGNMSFNIGPLWVGLINAWFNLALGLNITWPYHSLWVLTQSYYTTLLFHWPLEGWLYPFSSASPNSSLNGFCSTYTTHLSGTWYGLLSGLSCKENVPLKHPIPLNMLANILCTLHVSLPLFLLSASTFGEDRK